MAAIVKNRILRVVISYTINGNRLTTSLHYGKNGAMATLDAKALLDVFTTDVLLEFVGVLSNEVQVEQLYCHAITPQLVNAHTIPQQDVVGLISGQAVPSNLAMILQLRQSDVDSNANGRIYVAGVPESKVVNSLLLGAYVTSEVAALEVALGAVLTDVYTATWTPVAVSRFSGGAPITAVGHTLDQVHAVRSLGTQRRRTTELRRVRA